MDGENWCFIGGGRVFVGVFGIGCSGGKSGFVVKLGGGVGNLYCIYGFIVWCDWIIGWVGDELGGCIGDLFGGGGIGCNCVIIDVVIKKMVFGICF